MVSNCNYGFFYFSLQLYKIWLMHLEALFLLHTYAGSLCLSGRLIILSYAMCLFFSSNFFALTSTLSNSKVVILDFFINVFMIYLFPILFQLMLPNLKWGSWKQHVDWAFFPFIYSANLCLLSNVFTFKPFTLKVNTDMLVCKFST